LALGLVARGSGPRYSLQEPPVPWFVLGFLALGTAGSFGLLPAEVKDLAARTSLFLMTAAMAAMGLHTQLAMLRRAGPRVIYAGALAFAGMAALSFALIHLLGI
jgi:uncharacterized membrane protein YadS